MPSRATHHTTPQHTTPHGDKLAGSHWDRGLHGAGVQCKKLRADCAQAVRRSRGAGASRCLASRESVAQVVFRLPLCFVPSW